MTHSQKIFRNPVWGSKRANPDTDPNNIAVVGGGYKYYVQPDRTRAVLSFPLLVQQDNGVFKPVRATECVNPGYLSIGPEYNPYVIGLDGEDKRWYIRKLNPATHLSEKRFVDPTRLTVALQQQFFDPEKMRPWLLPGEGR